MLNGLSLAATVNLPINGVTTLRLKLTDTALGGYRAGVLLSATSAVLGLNAVGAVTLRTYLGADVATAVLQEEKVVSVTPAQAQLLASNGPPEQVEFTTTKGKNFNQVEIVFGSVLTLGTGINVHYAYGVGATTATQVSGLVSRFASPAGQYEDGGCAPTTNPTNAVDADLTNFATFSSLATVNCSSRLRVKLEGTAPSGYQAGFVIGNTNNLLDAQVLSSLVLRTHDAAGNVLETAAVSSLLGLTALPDGRSLISFPTTQAFSSVSIEQTGLVTALNSLQLYYGVGVASATATPQVLSKFASGTGHNSKSTTGVCVACNSVDNADDASGPNLNKPATVQVGLGVANSTTLRLDLNAAGQAGNRAGIVLGNTSLLDADIAKNVTLSTYDSNGNLLETSTSSSLLMAALLPDGRRTISFNTTQNFSKVGITVGGLVGLATTTEVYYAFADNSNGSVNLVAPAPLPVSLTSFGVRRLAGSGMADVSWTTASELNSARFVVERSANPADGFQTIGQVAAAGSSSTPRQYSLRDATAATQATTPLYYRLRQVDNDGRETLSAVAVLAASPALASFSIYPNPAPASASSITLSTSTVLAAGSSINVYSGLGQLLSTRVINASDAEAALTVPTTGLATGLYHVVLRDAGGQPLSSQRLVIGAR
ncbi:T9SS type A sorting domain-containing protein [Hymenobacter ginkgonis]|uniref:T9SS type A sorting domain-containing protein n=1 Tax=Hymenobacter ginkgonis TaxID=2682976 RepID=UPI0018DC4C62|nr:T9SS type A sorting domain-containing protein [Hymenobacter ginkgonis]